MTMNSRIRRISQRQEKVTAAEHGARQVPASGAIRNGGYDARNQGVEHIECKFTSKKSYSIKRDELNKLRIKAMQHGETAVFRFGFESGGRLDEFIILPVNDYLALREAANVSGDTGDDEDDENNPDEDDDENSDDENPEDEDDSDDDSIEEELSLCPGTQLQP